MPVSSGCLRYLLLVICAHPFAKEAFTLHLARSEGHERYFGCNLMHRKVLASSYQHLMAEAPLTSETVLHLPQLKRFLSAFHDIGDLSANGRDIDRAGELDLAT